MNLVTLPSIEKEKKLNIREQAFNMVEEGGEHYAHEGDVVVITLDAEGTRMSINSTLGVLETVGLLELIKKDAMGASSEIK